MTLDRGKPFQFYKQIIQTVLYEDLDMKLILIRCLFPSGFNLDYC
jgi:hypothetical protein